MNKEDINKATEEYLKSKAYPWDSCSELIKVAFKAGANYRDSQPIAGMKELKEIYYQAAGRGDLQNSTDLIDVDAVWDFFEPYLKYLQSKTKEIDPPQN